MNFAITKNEKLTLVDIDINRLDIACMQEVKETLQTLLKEHKKIVLNMKSVTFVDSSGLSVLISLLKRSHELEESSLTLCELQSQPKELLEITQLNTVFDVKEACN